MLFDDPDDDILYFSDDDKREQDLLENLLVQDETDKERGRSGLSFEKRLNLELRLENVQMNIAYRGKFELDPPSAERIDDDSFMCARFLPYVKPSLHCARSLPYTRKTPKRERPVPIKQEPQLKQKRERPVAVKQENQPKQKRQRKKPIDNESLEDKEIRLSELLIQDDLVRAIGDIGITYEERARIESELKDVKNDIMWQRSLKKQQALLSPPSAERIESNTCARTRYFEYNRPVEKVVKQTTPRPPVALPSLVTRTRQNAQKGEKKLGRDQSPEWNTVPRGAQSRILDALRIHPPLANIFKYTFKNAPFSPPPKGPKTTRRRGVRNDGRRPVFMGKRLKPGEPIPQREYKTKRLQKRAQQQIK